MYIDVYIDALFAVNFLADLFILALVRRLAARAARFWQLALGAAVCAGLYVAAVAFLPFGAPSVIISAPMLCAGLATAFCPVPAPRFLKLAGLAYLLAFLIGGCATAIGARGFPLLAVPCSMGLAYLAAKAAQKALAERALKRQAFCTIRVSLCGKRTELVGLVDTGNALTEPISGAAVIVAEAAALKGVLPEAVTALFKNEKQDDLAALLESLDGTALYSRLRMVPFSSVGRAGGVLPAFRPDEPAGAVIAIYAGKLSSGEYNALVNPLAINDIGGLYDGAV